MNIAILTAGGIGSRTHQDLPKQFITVDNKPIIVYTLEAFQQHPNIDEIYVACLEGWNNVLDAYAKQFNISKLKRIVIGGKTGQESIYNALTATSSQSRATPTTCTSARRLRAQAPPARPFSPWTARAKQTTAPRSRRTVSKCAVFWRRASGRQTSTFSPIPAATTTRWPR